MQSLKLFTRSVIESHLGPNKSFKVVIDDKDNSYFCQCPLQLLQETNIKDPLVCLIQGTLSAHHEQFGCSTLSFLAMWYLWDAELQLAIEEGCEMQDVIKYAQKYLENTISLLTEISITVEQLFNFPMKTELSIIKSKKVVVQKNSKYLNPKTKILKQKSSSIPVGIQYSSRHFSPAYREPDLNKDEDIPGTQNNLILNFLNEEDEFDREVIDQFRCIVKKISHNENECPELIQRIWIDQVKAKKEIKFCIDGIIICPITAPSIHSTVVQGLLIKSKFNNLFNQDFKIVEPCKTLIIKGSITYKYVHLGFSPKTSVVKQLKPEDIEVSQKKEWIEECCSLISKFGINLLLVKDDVDPAIASYCAAHYILLIDGMSWDIMKVLCRATNASACTYLLDCDEENVITNITLRKWTFPENIPPDYYQINVRPQNEKVPLFTAVLCHPSEAVLDSLGHQFWHLASRLKLATENKLLPGGGKTEEWCCQKLKKFPFENCTESRIAKAVADGFSNFSTMISKKIFEPSSQADTFDEFQSKVNAWHSAMELLMLTLQCDSLLINGCEDTSVNQRKFGECTFSL